MLEDLSPELTTTLDDLVPEISFHEPNQRSTSRVTSSNRNSNGSGNWFGGNNNNNNNRRRFNDGQKGRRRDTTEDRTSATPPLRKPDGVPNHLRLLLLLPRYYTITMGCSERTSLLHPTSSSSSLTYKEL